jgi:hypothetical protein
MRRMRLEISRVGMGNALEVLVRRPEGKISLGRREDNTKMHHREIRWEDVDWIHVA